MNRLEIQKFYSQVSEGPSSDTSSDEEEKRRPKHLYRLEYTNQSINFKTPKTNATLQQFEI